MVLAGIELILFAEASVMLCFGFLMKILVIKTCCFSAYKEPKTFLLLVLPSQ